MNKSLHKPSEPTVVTFGCRLNSFESEIIKDNARTAGLTDTIIFNTCAVTAEATRQARQAIRRSHRENPDQKIIVTGCAAQINPKEFADLPEVFAVLGNQEKMVADSFASLRDKDTPSIQVNDIMSVRETAGHLIDSLDGKSRAFVQIQNGCDHRCTFCIIPYGRGNSRSVPIGEAVRQIQKLVENGYNEIVLTGVDITSFGPDLPGKPSLGTLVKNILSLVPNLPRLRLSSIDSIEIDPTLLDIILNEPRLMPHLHLSLQAGDNMILKRMKRRHSREQAIEFTDTVLRARPEVVFGADIIAGFPTETDEMFENSLKLIDDCSLTYMHVFPYSAREGTPAAKMPQLPKAVRKQRAALLRAKGDQALDQLLNQLNGSIQNVLIERTIGDQASFGHAENFAPVKIISPEKQKTSSPMIGQIVETKIIGIEDGILIGNSADE